MKQLKTMRKCITLCGFIVLVAVRASSAESLQLPVTKDNSIVLVDGEWSENAGPKGQIRIKANQHIVAMAFDMSATTGRLVKKATLVCVQGQQSISGVTVSTIPTLWDENRSNGLTAGVDGIDAWGYQDARFPAVIGGNAFTLNHHVKSEIRGGHYHWDVPRDMVHAMAIGVAHGIAIHEDDADVGRNPTIFAHEQSGKQPYLIVELDDQADPLPAPPTDLHLMNADSASAHDVQINYRIDISRPEFCRGQMDHRSDLWVVSSWAFQHYRRLVMDRIERDGLKAWVYGTSNHVHETNRNIQAWALDAWQDGATGIVPWQTINKSGSALKEADQLGLFIFDTDKAGETVIRHSIRLKAYREAQQLIEYLNLLKQRRGWSQDQMRRFINQYIELDAQVNKTNEADAGTTAYGQISPSDIEILRVATAKLLTSPLK